MLAVVLVTLNTKLVYRLNFRREDRLSRGHCWWEAWYIPHNDPYRGGDVTCQVYQYTRAPNAGVSFSFPGLQIGSFGTIIALWEFIMRYMRSIIYVYQIPRIYYIYHVRRISRIFMPVSCSQALYQARNASRHSYISTRSIVIEDSVA